MGRFEVLDRTIIKLAHEAIDSRLFPLLTSPLRAFLIPELLESLVQRVTFGYLLRACSVDYFQFST